RRAAARRRSVHRRSGDRSNGPGPLGVQARARARIRGAPMRGAGWLALAAVLCALVWGLHFYADGIAAQARSAIHTIHERDAAACPDGHVTLDQRCVYP